MRRAQVQRLPVWREGLLELRKALGLQTARQPAGAARHRGRIGKAVDRRCGQRQPGHAVLRSGGQRRQDQRMRGAIRGGRVGAQQIQRPFAACGVKAGKPHQPPLRPGGEHPLPRDMGRGEAAHGKAMLAAMGRPPPGIQRGHVGQRRRGCGMGGHACGG
ncbi:MAG: hypothetical protein V4712_13325 [Pseudomonadota bacterium]